MFAGWRTLAEHSLAPEWIRDSTQRFLDATSCQCAPPAFALSRRVDSARRVELVRGCLLVQEPPGGRHSEIEARIVGALSMYLTRDRNARRVERTRGRLVCGDSGFRLSRDPDTVRAPTRRTSRANAVMVPSPTGTPTSHPTSSSRCGRLRTGQARCSAPVLASTCAFATRFRTHRLRFTNMSVANERPVSTTSRTCQRMERDRRTRLPRRDTKASYSHVATECMQFRDANHAHERR
jgi:hypothetical protein